MRACSGHGTCNEEFGLCQCEKLWYGYTCRYSPAQPSRTHRPRPRSRARVALRHSHRPFSTVIGTDSAGSGRAQSAAVAFGSHYSQFDSLDGSLQRAIKAMPAGRHASDRTARHVLRWKRSQHLLGRRQLHVDHQSSLQISRPADYYPCMCTTCTKSASKHIFARVQCDSMRVYVPLCGHACLCACVRPSVRVSLSCGTRRWGHP